MVYASALAQLGNSVSTTVRWFLFPSCPVCAVNRTMWGFLRVENEHLQIYGGASTLGTDQDSLGEHLLVSSTSSSTSTVAAGSTVSVGASGSDRGNGWESRAEWPLGTINRGSGLDSMPYSRMDIAPNGGVLRRATSPLKAWCLTRVRYEASQVPRLMLRGS